MITKLEKVNTRIAILHNIPKKFFKELEGSTFFGDHLFPAWTNEVFRASDLKLKFERVYNNYKEIHSISERYKIIDAFHSSNQVEKLCCNDASVSMIKLEELPISIQSEIKNLFIYLYENALDYWKFKEFVNDSIKKTVDRFISKNKLQVVCPFCGLETYLNLEGQSRLPLDHWLNKGSFPMASINLNNLVPIGKDCNDGGVKGSKNILIDSTTNNRIVAYYPFLNHLGVETNFNYVNEPKDDEILDSDWEINIIPKNPAETPVLKSWMNTMNIQTRYNSYFKKNILSMWEEDYKDFVNDPDNELKHANTTEELKRNFIKWRGNFILNGRPGSIVYRAFIDYLINRASETYLHGLYENFKR